MQDTDETVRPKWITGLLAMAALLVVIAVGMSYPFASSVGTAEATDAGVPSAPPADLSRFSEATWFLPDDGMLGFVRIPGGPFLMGSDPARDPRAFENERWSPEQAQGTVELPDFYLGRYEVTVAQYRAFSEATGYTPDPQALDAPADHPVVAVSWTDALAYTRWLEREMREAPATPQPIREMLEAGWRITLPTEAQWEKAARGPDGRIFPWGDVPDASAANFAAASTAPVGSFECEACAYGLSDMSGNAWEWTRSPYQPLPYTEADDRENLEADALWVMRGGSYADPPELVRSALRGGADPGVRRPFIGFRLALTPP